jgi:nucleotide-binding universal stress UspA family protein
MKTILACLTSAEHAEDVLSLAVPLARRFDAHVIGFHPVEMLAVYPGMVAPVPEAVYVHFEESREEIAESIREVFEHRVKAEDFASEWRQVRTESLSAAARIVEAARTCDVVVMAQASEDEDQSDIYLAQENVIRQSGRPVLHVPRGFKGEAVGKSVVIGWSPTREAARAVHDALALMEPGSKAAIVSVSDSATHGYDAATELARALDRHGIEAEVVERSARKADVAETLRREALERGADLIVTGAFGHSRIYDFVIGAVTLDLMRHAELPVLFSR